MIQAAELRIGNWVMDVEPYNDIFQISGIHIHKAENGWEYRPIELTGEVLINCGFYDHGISYPLFRLNDFTVERSRSDKTILAIYYNEKILSYRKYLHQLQNLYFAITNEELNYKP